MTEREAPAPDDSAATQRTADRIIRQVGDLLLKHGELSAWAVHKPTGSDWVDAPTNQKIGKWFHFGCYGNRFYYVWPHSIDWKSRPVQLFDSICQSLTALLLRQSPRLPDELADWMRGDVLLFHSARTFHPTNGRLPICFLKSHAPKRMT